MNKLLLIFSLLNFNSYSQTWIEIASGTDFTTETLFSDSVSGKLYVGGNFRYVNNNLLVNRIASWDGYNWDSLGPGANQFSSSISSIERYRSNIIATGNFFTPVHESHLGIWDGTNWLQFSGGPNSGVYLLKECFDTLYAFGLFDSINNSPASGIGKWDGNQWHPVRFNCSDLSFIAEGTWYQNQFYICGNFLDTISGSNDFAVLINDSLNKVGGINIANGLQVLRIVEFQGKLYIAGNFPSYGNFGANIVSWDGQQFSSVGGGTDDFIWNMKVIDNSLYVVGAFQHAGALQSQYIARWDGVNWHPVGNSIFNGWLGDIAEYNNEVYIAGSFTIIDGQPVNYIAKYSIPLSEIEHEKETSIYIYPIPCESELNFRIQNNVLGRRFIRICNILGSEFSSLQLSPNQNNFSVNTSSWAAGVYFVELITEEGRIVKKVIKN